MISYREMLYILRLIFLCDRQKLSSNNKFKKVCASAPEIAKNIELLLKKLENFK